MIDESQADVSIHGFWNWGTSDLFDMQIVNLDTCSYLRQTSTKALATAEKEKRDKHHYPCLECRRYFTPMVYSTNGIPGTEAVAAQRRLTSLLSNKLKQEYLDICGLVRAQMSLSIVRSNTLLLRLARDKGSYTRKRPNLEGGEVMALLEPCRG